MNELTFCFNEQKFNSLDELTQYLETLLLSSYAEFQEFIHCMIDCNNNLDTQFEAWLIALGKGDELEQWRKC